MCCAGATAMAVLTSRFSRTHRRCQAQSGCQHTQAKPSTPYSYSKGRCAFFRIMAAPRFKVGEGIRPPLPSESLPPRAAECQRKRPRQAPLAHWGLRHVHPHGRDYLAAFVTLAEISPHSTAVFQRKQPPIATSASPPEAVALLILPAPRYSTVVPAVARFRPFRFTGGVQAAGEASGASGVALGATAGNRLSIG